MKSKYLITMLMISVAVAGCGNKADPDVLDADGKQIEYAYHDDKIDLAEYKGLENTGGYEEGSVTPDVVDEYIDNQLYDMYGNDEEGNQMYHAADLNDTISTELAGDTMSAEEYRSYVKSMLEDAEKEYYETTEQQRLFEQVVTLSNAKEYDTARVDDNKEYLDNFYRTYADQINVDWDEFRKNSIGCETDEEYDTYLENEAKENAKREMVIDTICKQEGITITDEDKEALLERFVDMGYADTTEAVRGMLSDEELERNAKYYKVMDLLMENSKS